MSYLNMMEKGQKAEVHRIWRYRYHTYHLSLTILGTTVRTEIPDDLKTSGEERF